jgi:hypothetical protein
MRKKIADAVFKGNPLTAWMLAGGRVETIPGATDIREPIIYAENSTVSSYKGYDKLNVAPTEELTAAKFNWRQVAGTVSISGEEEMKNAGPQAIFKMLGIKVEVLQKTFRQELNKMLLREAAIADDKDFLGLDHIVQAAAAASQGTVGGISRPTYTWWANKYVTTTATTVTDTMRTFLNDVSEGIERPDLILTTQTLFEQYEKEGYGKLQLQDTKALDLGFDTQKFKGLTMMWDSFLEDSTIRQTANLRKCMYFLNSRYLGIKIHKQRNFVMSKFMKPIDQDARTAQMLLMGNLTIANSRYQGVAQFTAI